MILLLVLDIANELRRVLIISLVYVRSFDIKLVVAVVVYKRGRLKLGRGSNKFVVVYSCILLFVDHVRGLLGRRSVYYTENRAL